MKNSFFFKDKEPAKPFSRMAAGALGCQSRDGFAGASSEPKQRASWSTHPLASSSFGTVAP